MATTSATTGIFSGGDARVIFAAARSTSSPLERRRRRRRRRRLTVARTTTTKDGDDGDDEGKYHHHHHHQGFENVKDAAMATCVRALAKLDVLDYHDVATRKPTTVRDATSDDDATTINIYGHVATIDLKETKEALDDQFIRRLHEPVVVRNASSMASRDAFDKTRDDERWTLRKLLEAYEEEEKRTGGTFQTNVRVRVRTVSYTHLTLPTILLV